MLFNNKGHLLQYRQGIKHDEIPSKINTLIEFKFEGWKVLKRREWIKTKINGSIEYYALMLKKSKNFMVLYFNDKGDLISNRKL